MKENWPFLVWLSLVACLANIPIVSQWAGPKLSAAEWAAWVQAIGSIVAILASVSVAVLLPAHQEAENQKARQARLILAILNGAGELSAFSSAVRKLRASSRIYNMSYAHVAASVRATVDDLKSISAVEIPSSARIHLISARANANILLMLLDYAHSEMGNGRSVSVDFFDKISEATTKDERKIRAYIAAGPIGQTPLPGYH